MIIVTQSKTAIVNFKNISYIFMKEQDNKIKVVAEDLNETIITLGVYETVDIAKRVIHDIITNYESKLLIQFKGLLSNEHESLLMKKYNYLLNNNKVLVNDERLEMQYIPNQKNVYYMPER